MFCVVLLQVCRSLCFVVDAVVLVRQFYFIKSILCDIPAELDNCLLTPLTDLSDI